METDEEKQPKVSEEPAAAKRRFNGIEEILNSGQTLFTLDQIAQALMVSLETAKRWVKDGKLMVLKLGGATTYRVELQALVMFINDSAVGYRWVGHLIDPDPDDYQAEPYIRWELEPDAKQKSPG